MYLKVRGRAAGAARTVVVSLDGTFAPPPYWQHQDLQGKVEEWVELPQEEAESLGRLMDDTWTGKRTRDRKDAEMPKGVKIVSAFRIENGVLWGRYAGCRAKIGRERGSCTSVESMTGRQVRTRAHETFRDVPLEEAIGEVYLWHGTTPTGAQGITTEGFRLDLAGSHAGTMFGKGVYLAECSSKSDEYAGDDKIGPYKHVYCMLLCRAVLGQVLELHHGGEAVHPQIQRELAAKRIDSILGNREAAVGTYREFIVYDKDQAYPEYLILYKRI